MTRFSFLDYSSAETMALVAGTALLNWAQLINSENALQGALIFQNSCVSEKFGQWEKVTEGNRHRRLKLQKSFPGQVEDMQVARCKGPFLSVYSTSII